MEVEMSRLAELLRKEWKLMALERGGVDNWDWYDDSLFPEDGKTLDDIEDTSDKEIIEDYL